MDNKHKPRVVIVGAGFGGLTAARRIARLAVQVTVVDRKNHHTFQPLLYQVATAGLSPGEIAAPIRWILRTHSNVEVLLEEVIDFNLEQKKVITRDQTLDYDYLIVASGAMHAYFGHQEWEPLAPGLKTIEDALEIRRRVLLAFELAERQAASGQGQMALNFVVIGGGPTGVELAGTLAEIARHALKHEFRATRPEQTRILLIEGGPRVLATYSEELSAKAKEQLERLGVEVRTSHMVTRVEPGTVMVGEERIPAQVVLWAAGVAASPLGRRLGVSVDRAGRVPVQPDLSIPGHPEVFVIGDLASLADESGKMLPGVAQVAIQQGEYVAKALARDLEHQPRRSFHYHDKGSLATIGRAAAVAQFPRVQPLGLLCLAVVAVYPHSFSDRLSQSPDRDDPVGVVLSHLRAGRAPYHRERRTAGMECEPEQGQGRLGRGVARTLLSARMQRAYPMLSRIGVSAPHSDWPVGAAASSQPI